MKRPLIGINMDFSESLGKKTDDSKYIVGINYVKSVCEAGGLPLLIPCTDDETLLEQYIEKADGFLFIGGRDYSPEWYNEPVHCKTGLVHERRLSADKKLAKSVLSRNLPVLGICAGHQLINIEYGGKLIQHLETSVEHTDENYHTVDIKGGRILADIFKSGCITVNSCHHQAIDPGSIGSGLKAVAWAEDGTIEAVESVDKNRFILGVQWHPERINDPEHRKLIFKSFIKATPPCSASETE